VSNLKEDIEELVRFKRLRDDVADLRSKGVCALQKHEGNQRWINLGSLLEAALLARVQRSDDASHDASFKTFTKRVNNFQLLQLFPDPNKDEINRPIDKRIPVVVSALSLEVLSSRSQTALSRESMIFYYRILYELSAVNPPDWTLGAARSGPDGGVSAFVTNECVRAVLVFSEAFTHAVDYFEHTRRLCEQFDVLQGMIETCDARASDHPIRQWIDKAVQRIWLDWFISTARARQRSAFRVDRPVSPNATVADVERYIRNLPEEITKSFEQARDEIDLARKTIAELDGEPPVFPEEYSRFSDRRRDHEVVAHKFAEGVIDRAFTEADEALKACTSAGLVTISRRGNTRSTNTSFPSMAKLGALLVQLATRFRRVVREIHKVLEPTRHYVESVLDRELAASKQFDAGDLVFAAASFGFITSWTQGRKRLADACGLLSEAVPITGMLSTRHTIHSTRRGYKLFPTGCEITRSLAALFEHTDYPFDPSTAQALVDSIRDKIIVFDDPAIAGWNFDGSAEQERPSVWVTAVTVLALERLMRMLDRRINHIVLSHFQVVQPNASRSSLTLNDLVYPDYGFSAYYGSDAAAVPLGVRLEQMRANLIRSPLPGLARRESDPKRVVSAVLYGPPGTGKTTLAEALATTSRMPLVMLSPFDLRTDSGQTVEGRSRLVFEALSMLTNAVILFDEFETALPRRDIGAMPTAEAADHPSEILAPVDSVLQGLLPHFAKLHEVARRQALVYFMATNDLRSVDEAAIRRGRFDIWLPVYKPDPLSRAGTLLYRLERIRKRLIARPAKLTASEAIRVLQVVASTKDATASTLADADLRLPAWATDPSRPVPPDGDIQSASFRHVLKGAEASFERPLTPWVLKPAENSWLKSHRSSSADRSWKDEMRERSWLASAERELVVSLNRALEDRPDAASRIFKAALKPVEHGS